MKSFGEFWSSISDDEFSEITKKVNTSLDKIREETEDPKNLFGNQIAITSAAFTYEILSRYHNWFSEQPEK